MTLSNLPPLVTVFGGSGFVGRSIVRALAKRGYRIRVAVRRPDLAGFLQPMGNVGQISLVQANLRYRASVDAAVAGATHVVNCVGILHEAGRNTFDAVQEFGARRVVDTPITEHGFAGVGVGAAMAGLKPIVEFMTFNFAMQAIDQIINSAAKTLYMSGGQMGAPIVFRGPNGAAARVAAQHSQDYAAWYSHIPGLKVVQPYTAADAKGLLKAAIRDPNPVIFLENEILYGQSFEVPKLDDFVLPIGKARIHRAGKDVTMVSWGIGMTYAVKAVEELTKEGIDVELIDLRTIRPMDLPAVIESVKKTGRLVTVEEGYPQSSVGDFIANSVQRAAFDYLDAPILSIAGKDVPMPYAANLEKLALPNVGEVVQAVKAVCYK